MVKKNALITSICTILTFSNVSLAATSVVPVNLTVEPAIIDVTVPSSLSIEMDRDGNILTANNAKIINNSQGAVVVSDVQITPKNSWSLASFDKDFSQDRIGTKKLALKINNSQTTDSGMNWVDNNTIVPGVGGVKDPELPLSYEAKLPLQDTTMSVQNIADVMFTIDWYK